MNLKKILTAAAAATILSVAGIGAADAAPFGHGFDRHDDGRGRHRVERVERRVVEHRVVFNTLRARHIRYVGTPYFVRGHYVVKSFDRFGHVKFVEVNPHTGGYIGFIRF
ncbi:MAG: hypothetical protein WDM91_13870 [Rhizomicrobium sp.]